MYLLLLLMCAGCLCNAAGEIDIQSEDAGILVAFQQEIFMKARPPGMQGWGLSSPSCNWTGVTCNIRGHVEALNLSNTGLHGSVNKKLGELQHLASLDLSHNFLFGPLPSQISNVSAMLHLDLSNNNFSGHIPESLGLLRQLELLNLGYNNLTGRLPASLSNCSQLKSLSLYGNFLTGSIPQEFSALSKLHDLSLYYNNLTGGIPPSLLLNCTGLQGLYLSYNNFSGSIPVEIAALPWLEELWLNSNNFSGTIPDGVGNLSSLTKLVLTRNKLGGKLPGTLGQLPRLVLGLFGVNSFTGGFPVELTNTTTLQQLRLHENRFTGRIPNQIGKLQSLIALFLNDNFFSGSIPPETFNCSMLDTIQFQHNLFDGMLPAGIGRLSSLGTLYLEFNRLSGRMPESLANCTRLQDLSLSYNHFTGEIPPSVAGMSTIVKSFSLAGNMLIGGIPSSLAAMDLVLSIDLSGNNLTGSIPSAISACKGLTSLNVSRNSLEGSIPELQQLESLAILDISNNKLTGTVPTFLGSMRSLKILNLSNNLFEGTIPRVGILANLPSSSFLGNPGLCGLPLQNKCSTGSNHKVLLYSLIGVGSFIACIVLIIGVRASELIKLNSSELRSATQGFNPSNIVGEGSSSTVYKGTLNNSTSVAVKVLTTEDATILKTELETLARIRHRNLVKVVGYCLQPDLKALVLQLFTGGTLHQHIHSGHQDAPEWKWLLEIAKGVAQGLIYLHHECGDPPVLHCDLKPSNILLDEDMVPHLADFGIARTPLRRSLTTSNFKGTIGYAAPECASSGKMSTKSDVYSYGIVLLEMLTRTSPTDQRFTHGMTLPKWVARAVTCGNAIDICLTLKNSFHEEEMLQLLELALYCCNDIPNHRPDMRQVVFNLNDILSSQDRLSSGNLPMGIYP